MTPLEPSLAGYGLIFGTSFVITLSGAMMPGPLFTAAIGGAMRRGAAAGPLLMLGHVLLEAALLAALFLGLAPFLASDAAFTTIALAGSLVMAWLALGMLRSVPTLTLAPAAITPASSGNRLVLSGALLSASNPYWLIWWATIGLGYALHCREQGVLAVALFFAGHAAADFLWYSAVTLAAARGRRFMSQTVYRSVVAACAVAMILFAGLFGWTGLGRLIS